MGWWFELFGDGDASGFFASCFIIFVVFGTALGVAYLLSH